MNKPNPIVVRPRKGSDLEFIWLANDRNAAAMREYFHDWASTFKLMSEQSKLEAFSIKEQSKGETGQ